MRLLPLSRDKQLWLKEFDHWVTPYLEEIRDSEIFRKTLSNIKAAIELLGQTNLEFKASDAGSPDHVADALLLGLNNVNSQKYYAIVISFCDLLFLLTGKTDNNYKCQFPVYIKEFLKWETFPVVRRGGLKEKEIPRVIDIDSIAKLISQLQELKATLQTGTLYELQLTTQVHTIQRKLLVHYFAFILNQDIYLRTLKIFGSKYYELKTQGGEDDLLAPIIIAYVRGSASATGGHRPEKILREHMNSWGLRANEDYNALDVKPFVAEESNNDKTRAYDFVLPFKVADWQSKIFIQSQFYAGDSGSVSHKNVDQTSNSRAAVKAKIANPIFVEYVDGAGYYGSLNGDLKKLLNMADTENFFQVRTFPIKLRQLLQEIGFLTPLELIHAIVLSDNTISYAKFKLKFDGYSEEEINRVIAKTENEKLAEGLTGGVLKGLNEDFYELSRRYFLLDCVVTFGGNTTLSDKGNILIPGYGEYFGAKTSYILEKINTMSGSYYKDWQHPETFARDLEFLLKNKWVIMNS